MSTASTRLLFVAAALALSACAFSSDRALFGPSDAAQPFADQARYRWAESAGESYDITFHLAGAGYDISEITHGDEPMEGVLFVPITDTPEEDYVVQAQLERGQDTYAYAFMWRVGDGYRLVTNPDRIVGEGEKLGGAEAVCAWQAYHECALSSREDVLALYRTGLYPRFVHGAEPPQTYMALTPSSAEP